jgi:carbonic anhydrase
MPIDYRTVCAVVFVLALPAGGAHAQQNTRAAPDEANTEAAAPKGKKALRAAAEPLDPMQDLRERLAAKLGGSKVADGKGASDVQISTKPDGELQVTAAATAAPVRKAPATAKPAAGKATSHAAAHWSYDGEVARKRGRG